MIACRQGRQFNSSAVLKGRDAFFMRAMCETENGAARFDTMANHFAAAMFAFGSERVDRAFEAIEIMGHAVDDNFERLVVIVFANFTLGHNQSFPCHCSRERFRSSRA